MRWHADRSIYNSLKAASLAEEVEGSLRRLQVETIDLYQIHWPNPDSEIEEGWERWRECASRARSAGSASRISPSSR
jgi:aryl-alcohol dehydrogenase-like predicted oxidoreductase